MLYETRYNSHLDGCICMDNNSSLLEIPITVERDINLTLSMDADMDSMSSLSLKLGST